jgi:hypothetical protein
MYAGCAWRLVGYNMLGACDSGTRIHSCMRTMFAINTPIITRSLQLIQHEVSQCVSRLTVQSNNLNDHVFDAMIVKVLASVVMPSALERVDELLAFADDHRKLVLPMLLNEHT